MKKIKPEIYSRVAGYFRPVHNWNKGKKEEFRQRKTQDVKKLNLNRKFIKNNLD